MDDEGFEEIKSEAWKPEQEGDQIRGILIQKQPKEVELGARYTIENKEGVHLVWGSAILDDRMERVNIGNELIIRYEGKKKLEGGRSCNLYKVFKREVSMTEVNPEPKDSIHVEEIE